MTKMQYLTVTMTISVQKINDSMPIAPAGANLPPADCTTVCTV